MNNIQFGFHDPAQWAAMRDWCKEHFGQSGDFGTWDYYVDIGAHGRIVNFEFKRDKDKTLFALRWLK